MASITQYLSLPFQQGGMEFKSSYIAALTDARAATGRDVNTGQVIDASKVGNWSGALSYMVLIDHIGIFISKLTGGNTDNTKFVKALKDFTTLSDPHIFTLYALRCAFAHQYSLINVGQGARAAMLHHQFIVHRGETLITLPATPWNGIRNPATHNLITHVSLKKLGDLVEEIHERLLVMAAAGQLRADGELLLITYQVQV
jgi:hypothetical protein